MTWWSIDTGEIESADGSNRNIRVGIDLPVFAAVMPAWVPVRPLRVSTEEGSDESHPDVEENTQ